MTNTNKWVSWLESKVGITEHPLGSNCCDICREYGNLGVSCYAWCCATQDLALYHTFGSRLLNTASVGQAKARAMAGVNGLTWIPRRDIENGMDLKVGDLPCYDYGGQGDWMDFHIEGIVNPYTNSRFLTIGGNRQNRCDYWWNSLNSSVMGFIRPPFKEVALGANQKAPINSIEEDDEVRLWLLKADNDNAVWITDLITKRHVKNEDELNDIVYLNQVQGTKMLWTPESGAAVAGSGSYAMVRRLSDRNLLDSIKTA